MPQVIGGAKRILYKPPVSGDGGHGKKGAVCRYWLQGRCNRNPCRFVHGEVPKPTDYTYHRNAHTYQRTSDQPLHAAMPNSKSSVLTSGVGRTMNNGDATLTKNPHPEPKQSPPLMGVGYDTEESGTGKHSHKNCHREPQDSSFLSSTCDSISQKDTEHSMILGTYDNGDKGQCLKWLMDEGVTRLAQLEGHNKAVSGIVLPQGSDKLYTGSEDGIFRIWDCHTGQCVRELNLGSEIGCMICDGPVIFIGLRSHVMVWNTQTSAEYRLEVPGGQVYALETTDKDMLFAGVQDGSILAWKYHPETNSFQFVTTLKGHSCGVLSLKVGRNSLYSGSMDNTIRRWDLDTLQCDHILNGHSAAVTSLLCWKNCLLSCSLDQTIKAWAYKEDGSLDVIYTHKEEHGVLGLFGINDADNKSMLFSSCADNSVRFYELPKFCLRGKIREKKRIRVMESGPGGLFFTSDGDGRVSVWKQQV